MAEPFEIITINWKPFGRVEGQKYPQGNCLYQAYGDSMIYGKDQLLYIGKTRDFERRNEEHIDTDFERILNSRLIIGEIVDYKTPAFNNRTEEQILGMLESILICYTKPSYNSSNIKDIGVNDVKTLILIHNTGNRGSLPLECSNFWWRDKLSNPN